MRKEDILKLPSMPASGPSYPAGPYRFIHREFMVITYETDPDIVRDQLPEPLEPVDAPLVHYEWIKVPVIEAASSEQRNVVRAAIWETSTNCLVGCAANRTSFITASSLIPRAFACSGICF